MDTCCHCGRGIVLVDGRWIDPEATGDDSVWRETCDKHDTFVAEHEPVEDWVPEYPDFDDDPEDKEIGKIDFENIFVTVRLVAGALLVDVDGPTSGAERPCIVSVDDRTVFNGEQSFPFAT